QRAFLHRPMLWPGHQHHIAFALVRALVMKMLHIFRQRMAERRFPKEDQPRETLLFNRSYPPLRIRIEVWRPRRERHPRPTSIINEPLKCWTVLPVSIMDEILPVSQEAPLFHGHIPRDLDHPALVRMWGHPSHVHLPAAQMDEKQDVVCHQPTERPH